jgi:hypothetical protein
MQEEMHIGAVCNNIAVYYKRAVSEAFTMRERRAILKQTLAFSLAILVGLIAACNHATKNEVVITLPQGFTGQVHIAMGVPAAAPLERTGNSYRITVPPDGKIETSTIVIGPVPRFEDVQQGHIWGYNPAIFHTGDHLPVGGNIDFFVGTREQYESAEAQKHKSGLPPRADAT